MMTPEIKPDNIQLSSETERMQKVFADLRSTKFHIPRKLPFRNNGTGTLIRNYKSMPNIAIYFHNKPTEVAGDAKICSPSAVPAEQPSEMCNAVSHIKPVSEAINRTAFSTPLSDAEVLARLERLANLPRYRKICLANYAGPQFRYYMSLVDEKINSPLVDESEMDTSMDTSIPQPTETSDVRPVQASQDIIVDRSTLRRCASMPNIHVCFELVGVNLHSHNPEQDTCDGIRSETRQAAGAEDIDVQPKRCKSIWSKTKRFVRRLFCCAA